VFTEAFYGDGDALATDVIRASSYADAVRILDAFERKEQGV
jgi:hypothetical protein